MTQATVTLSLANLRDAADPAPLYYQYPQQCQPQPAYVQLDEDGEVSADYSADTGGGTPATVWHNRTLRWTVPAAIRGPVLAKMIEGEALPLLARVHAGHTVEWDGNNQAGSLDADAQAASSALETMFENLNDDPDELQAVWSVGDWLWSNCTLIQHWDKQPLDEAVAAIEADAKNEGVVLEDDVRTELLDRAQSDFDEDGDDGLTDAHLVALVADGRITQDEADVRRAD